MGREKVVEYFEMHPDSIIFPLIADIKLEEGDVSGAIELCATGVQKHPDLAVGHYVYSVALRRAGELEKAIEELKKTLFCDSSFLQAYRDLLEIGENSLSDEDKRLFRNRIEFLGSSRIEEYVLETEESVSEPEMEEPVEDIVLGTAGSEIGEEKEEREAYGELEEDEREEKEEEEALSVETGQEGLPEEEAHLGPIEKENREAEGEVSSVLEQENKQESKFEDSLKASEASRVKSMFEQLKAGFSVGLQEKIRSEKMEDLESEGESKEFSDLSKEESPDALSESEKGKEEGKTKTTEGTGELHVPVPTFTLVEILKKQKLYDQALDVLKVLERRHKDMDRIAEYRAEILRLKAEAGGDES